MAPSLAKFSQSDGDYSLVTSQQEAFFNFYNPGDENDLDNMIFYYLSFTQSPPRLAGGAILIHETLNQIVNPRNGWGMTQGSRVRRAPNLGYDSPIAAAENLRTADDTDILTVRWIVMTGNSVQGQGSLHS